ncbi:MAG: flagellar hook-basal body complex protein FliE [Leptolinea sp.]
MNVPGIRPSILPQIESAVRPPQQSTLKEVGKSFDSMLTNLSQTQNYSDNLMTKLAAGEEVDLHQVMISADQTDISFKVAMGIRDKLVDAYKEISRMNV